ncbi:MAG: S-methyl-5-thioribose-1-phosphate isomerase [Chloroflexi bacterium]|jgi:methylthioribose-1-phosphate isomerase|nr:S-methyl-5-thioribose-1-phosphate isomerase [Chloroflexota bacterium]
MKTVEWDFTTHKLQMIDQRLLPGTFEVAVFDDYRAVAQAITDMVVRGAPAIGAAAGFGLALAAIQSGATTPEGLLTDLKSAADLLKKARPTAVNLAWALDRILNSLTQTLSQGERGQLSPLPRWGRAEAGGILADLRAAVLTEAQRIADEDVEINQRMARHGAELIEDGDTIIHHCNTGALATVDWGTALGVIRLAHEQGKRIHVLVDETRPRLQGSRLTAWELTQYGIPYDIISDNAAGHFLSSGQVDKVFVGSDRTAANGDVCNKIGTYMLALAAYDNGVPFYPVVPTSTIDMTLATGAEIPIEERTQAEVLSLTFQGQAAFPEGASARNPAFDVTPHRLVTGIVTENGVAYPPFITNLAPLVKR